MSLSRALVVLAATPLVLLAACSSKDEPAATAPATETVTVTASASVSATQSPSPSDLGRCRTDRLRVSINGGAGAGGTVYYTITIANVGSVPCTTGGYGVVSYAGGATGGPIGEPAVHDQTVGKPTSFVLAPGETATARLQEPEYQNYGAAQCQPVEAGSLEIVPPRDFEAQFVPHVGRVCSSAKVRLDLEPYVKS